MDYTRARTLEVRGIGVLIYGRGWAGSLEGELTETITRNQTDALTNSHREKEDSFIGLFDWFTIK